MALEVFEPAVEDFLEGEIVGISGAELLVGTTAIVGIAIAARYAIDKVTGKR